jgi:glucose/arabinose dehydrogenase
VRRAVALAALLAVAGCNAVKEPEAADPLATSTTLVDAPVPSSDPAPSTTTTTAPLPQPGPEHVELAEIAVVDQPVAFAARAGDDALYVAERPGRVRRIEIRTTSRRRSGSSTPVTTQTFQLDRTPVLDLTDDVVSEGQEQGLLGLTFSTDGNRLYVAYTGTDGRQHLDELRMGAERPETGTRRELLVIDDFAPNHNGGQLVFGPDGFLYWGMGDGGGAGDPEATGQDPSDLLGSILRIDPDVAPDAGDGAAYAVPDGNPFVGGGGAPEVWAYGLRNPWRFSFDRDTGDLWIGDVGQGEREEVDFLPATEGLNAGRGANLGWSAMEGDEPFEGGEEPEGHVPPVHAYATGDGCAVIGGYVYRGARIGPLAGAYLFGDACQGEVLALIARDGEVVDQRVLGLSVPSLSSFGEDAAGELYALSLEGPVYRIVPEGS